MKKPKKICDRHIQKALAIRAKFRGMIERPDKLQKVFKLNEKF